jgi:hypothetical protein
MSSSNTGLAPQTKHQQGKRNVYIYNPVVGETTLRFTYYPIDYTGNPCFSLEMSLPKLIFGNNYQMIGSIDGSNQDCQYPT